MSCLELYGRRRGVRFCGATLERSPPPHRYIIIPPFTFDNGTEFARHYRLHALGIQTFFCDTHSPWQKGGVENAIGRLRRPLPRSTNLAALSEAAFTAALQLYNNTPRKCLGYRTPAEVFHDQVLHFKCESTERQLRERALAVLGEVPGQEMVYRQGGAVSGESSCIRERARALGMSMGDLAERVGVSPGYMTQVSRGHRSMGVKVQARLESALAAPAEVAPAKRASVDRETVWDRMDAHGVSQNEVARRAGVSSGYLSEVMAGKATPSPAVLQRLHGVLYRRAPKDERVMPTEVQVLGWRKGERSGMVVRGAGAPSTDDTVRIGGRGPWGAEVEYAFRTGYDGRGRVSVTPVVERTYAFMLKRHLEDGV